MYDLEKHVFCCVAGEIKVDWDWGVSFYPGVFSHSVPEFPFCFSYVLLFAWCACDKIDQIARGAVALEFAGVGVTSVRAR